MVQLRLKFSQLISKKMMAAVFLSSLGLSSVLAASGTHRTSTGGGSSNSGTTAPPKKKGTGFVGLPNISFGDSQMYQDGYYSYSPASKQFASNQVIRALKNAGAAMAGQGMVMSIGDLSYAGGGEMKPHKGHRKGTSADIRLMMSDGVGARGTYGSDGYSRSNTFEMIKAIIDADPMNVAKLFINSTKLATEVRNYVKKTYPKAKIHIGPCPGHDNHLHVEWYK
jgi:hypothetical protein